MSIVRRKKLIEVALPLEAVNAASAKEKSIRHGHPSTLHLWWARRPLAAARAVIFASLVDDPSSDVERFPSPESQLQERKRLFGIMELLVKWENTNNEDVLTAARREIQANWLNTCRLNAGHPKAKEIFNPMNPPGLHDPFAGGGAIPLEAQRLGLSAYASDLNPVAVLINKAMIDIPPRFCDRPAVGPVYDKKNKALVESEWKSTTGLAEDVRRYGNLLRSRVKEKIGDLYPEIEISSNLIKNRPDLKPYKGQKLKVIAWLWARTVKSPNPGFSEVDVPLASSFILSEKKDRQAWVKPVIKGNSYRFTVEVTKPPLSAKKGTKLARGANFKCLMSNTPIDPKYIYSEANAGRMGAKLMAIVVDSKAGRLYLPPLKAHEELALNLEPSWRPEVDMPENPRWFSPPLYGLKTFGDLFTDRQLVVLNTYSETIPEIVEEIEQHALLAGFNNDKKGLDRGGRGALAYAQAVSTYLAISLSRMTDICNAQCRWEVTKTQVRNLFGRQAIPMMWDYAENNVFAEAAGDYIISLGNMVRALEELPATVQGFSMQADAQNQTISAGKVISTDPPYFDNIGYADLSDFFYVWLRRSLRPFYPSLFATVAVPKAEELVATPYRHGGKEAAEEFFLTGMTKAIRNISSQAHPAFPVTIYYAFKQSETDGVDEGTASTGWETFLEAVILAGFSITGTWPMRTELANRMIGKDTNALASSIVLVCRQRLGDAQTISRREYFSLLKRELPESINHLLNTGIAAVDLAQSAIGPGMAIFSRHKAVLESDDTPMSVRSALVLINEVLDTVLTESEGDLDSTSRWAVAWFEQYGFKSSTFDEANKLAQAKNIGLDALSSAGIVSSKAGRVSLIERTKFKDNWYPEASKPVSYWFGMQHLIRRLTEEGEEEAGLLLRNLGGSADRFRDLAYRCFAICEKNQWTQEAIAYNSLVSSWSSIASFALDRGNMIQGELNAQ